MRDEFKIQRQGKDFVLYAGLLDEAHSKGLRGIETEPLQYPWDNDEGRAVVRARAKMAAPEKNEDGEHYTVVYTGIGDACATAKGAGNAEKDAPIRMAETRAKARALRDAINVGVTALEEMGGGEGPTTDAPDADASGAVQGAAKDLNPATKDPDAAKQATRPQIKELTELLAQDAKHQGITPAERMDQMQEYLGFELQDLSRGEAETWLRRFHKSLAEPEEEASG